MSGSGKIVLRKPTLEDGLAVHRLVDDCPPLDPNSSYCNFMQCSHFADTCVAAELDGRLVGFVSAYFLPAQPDTLFVWQIAVHETARGQALGRKMLESLLARRECEALRFVETTIDSENAASRRVFEKLAAAFNATIYVTPWLDQERHFNNSHPSEPLVRIGPFNLQREEL